MAKKLIVATSSPAASERRLLIGQKSAPTTPRTPPVRRPVTPVIGLCEHDGKRFYASRIPGQDTLTLCVPSDKGILLRSDTPVQVVGEVKFTEITGAIVEDCRLAPFQSTPEFEIGEKMVTVKDGENRVIDYQDVYVSGLASEFSEDRDGETVLPGAFKSTLATFRTNPVMLIDHINSVRNIAGSFTRLSEGSNGLQVEGKISNSPELRAVRFLVAEKHLRAFSIGGLLKFNQQNFREIEQVTLFEISLVAVPANPKALFVGKTFDLETAKKAFSILH